MVLTHFRKQIKEQRARLRALVLDSDTPGAFDLLERELGTLKYYEQMEKKEALKKR